MSEPPKPPPGPGDIEGNGQFLRVDGDPSALHFDLFFSHDVEGFAVVMPPDRNVVGFNPPPGLACTPENRNEDPDSTKETLVCRGAVEGGKPARGELRTNPAPGANATLLAVIGGEFAHVGSVRGP